jgi:hypothetical protein
MKTNNKALFIPLKTEWFRAFQDGSKIEEFRPLGPRWNPDQCIIGRAVTLSKGYGPWERLTGTIIGFRIERDTQKIKGWQECYGDRPGPVACIKIKVHENHAAASR